MGNLCSKSSNETEAFSQPGRVLGSSSQPSATTSAPPRKITSSTPGRTLGGRDESTAADDARSAAARAAEERASKKPPAQGKGKLAAQLEAQKKMTRNELLAASSEQERRARDADASVEARTYN